MTMSEKACTEITHLKHNEFLKKSGCLPTSSLPLISRTRSVCLAASAMDMSSSTLLSAGCTKKLFSCSQTILSSQKPPECAHQELDIAVAPGRTMQNPMSRRQDTKLRHLVTNNSGGQQCSSWSNNHKQKQTAPTQGHFSFSHKQGTDQPSLTFPFPREKSFFKISLPGPAIIVMLEETAKCKQQSRNHKHCCNKDTHTHTRTYFTSFRKLLGKAKFFVFSSPRQGASWRQLLSSISLETKLYLRSRSRSECVMTF